ncbi:PH domain-containing protein [Propionibacteriaceae bacterium Y2011]|uniref:PH domain-containing protein n=1 Tax=Microlunatus sp. Y2014 TaxID=3418488 RepID=UPI003B4EA66D
MHPHQQAEPVVIRSGVANLLRWMGLALLGIAVLIGIVAVTIGLVTGDMEAVTFGALMTLIFGGGGLLMHLAGRRQRVELRDDGIRWCEVFSGTTHVRWGDVHHVEVPLNRWDGRSVRLIMKDGRRMFVSAISMSSSEHGVWADSGYSNAGNQIVAAHQAWLANLR